MSFGSRDRVAAVVLLSSSVPDSHREELRCWCRRSGTALRVFEDPAVLESELECHAERTKLSLMRADAESVAGLVPWVQRTSRHVPIVVLGDGLDTASVVELVRAGAVDVVPVDLPVALAVARVMRHGKSPPKAGSGGELVGSSAAMVALRRSLAAAARTPSTVLLTGETGTGKGVVAREIHRASPHSRARMVTADCSCFPPSVIESELFGHERGAFTGAVAARQGRFERAQGGTLFLDEIGDLDLSLQTRLLRVLQDREYERVGSSEPRRSDARIIAATNRDLRRAVAEGRFRSDLLFRLYVLHIRVPPLRERSEDIPELTEAGLHRLAARFPGTAPRLSDACLAALQAHAWPGNVRELLNLLERLYVEYAGCDVTAEVVARLLAESPVAVAPAGFSPGSGGGTRFVGEGPADGDPERARILEALAESRGNVARAARGLGIARSTLRYRMRQHGLA